VSIQYLSLALVWHTCRSAVRKLGWEALCKDYSAVEGVTDVLRVQDAVQSRDHQHEVHKVRHAASQCGFRRLLGTCCVVPCHKLRHTSHAEPHPHTTLQARTLGQRQHTPAPCTPHMRVAASQPASPPQLNSMTNRQ
jgi:hypothetical protein